MNSNIQSPSSSGKSIIYNGGVSKNVNLAIILLTSVIVCSLSIYWIKDYSPEGTYFIIFFLPCAFLGYIFGIFAANLVNLLYKPFNSQ